MLAGAHNAHRRFLSIAVAVLVVAAVLPIGATSVGRSLNGTVEVMLLGDSITEGVLVSSDNTGYRRELWLSQVAAGRTLDFVGSRSTGIPSNFDKHHEGHSGLRADEIRDGVTGWLTTNPADIVLLHVGTNDISQDQSAVSTANEIGQILNAIKALDATTWVIVAQIVPRNDGNSTRQQSTIDLNNRIANLVAARIAAGDQVRLVDLYSPLDPSSDIADNVHPGDSGYSKMAAVWDTALDTLFGPDATPPMIALLGPNPQMVGVDSAYEEQGATATDNVDGDLSGDLAIDASAVDTTAIGTYQVTYDVSDAAGNAAAQVVRVVEVVENTPDPDTTPPVITLLGDNPQTVELADPYTDPGASASDDVDGDITANITADISGVATTAIGTYQVTYDVSDAAGNAAAQVVRAVEVEDTTPPTIVLIGANPQVIQAGGAYVELDAVVLDNQSAPVGVVIDSSQVDVSKVGSYQVFYDATDASGNEATEVVRTVSVQALPPAGGGGGGGGTSVLPAVVVNPCPDTIPDAGFTDLAGLSDETRHAVDCLVHYGISQGTSAATFSPGVSVTRWQMALFLTRQLTVLGVSLPEAVDQGFSDIGGLPSATREAINQLALLGIAKGTSTTTFDPGDPVTRWQMALFLTRLLAVHSVSLEGAPTSQFFDIVDLPASTRLAINQLAVAQVVNGTSATTFDPQGFVLRWHMALFLTRVLLAGGLTPT